MHGLQDPRRPEVAALLKDLVGALTPADVTRRLFQPPGARSADAGLGAREEDAGGDENGAEADGGGDGQGGACGTLWEAGTESPLERTDLRQEQETFGLTTPAAQGTRPQRIRFQPLEWAPEQIALSARLLRFMGVSTDRRRWGPAPRPWRWRGAASIAAALWRRLLRCAELDTRDHWLRLADLYAAAHAFPQATDCPSHACLRVAVFAPPP